MIFIEKIKFIERVDSLIRKHSTGNPKELSEKLCISERHVYNLINIMKDMGAPIYYCPYSESYCYNTEVYFNSGFYTKNLKMEEYKGGVSKRYHFYKNNNWISEYLNFNVRHLLEV